jgi:hypothetical protein
MGPLRASQFSCQKAYETPQIPVSGNMAINLRNKLFVSKDGAHASPAEDL